MVFIGIPMFVSQFIPSKEERKLFREERARKRELEKQEKLRLEEEAVYEKEVKQQDGLKRKGEEHQKYLDLEKQIRIMPIYERWRQDAFKKCGKLCQICGSDKNLEVHHRVSFYSIMKDYSITSKERAFECWPLWDIDNGEVLCKECHDKMESSKNRQTFVLENNF